MRNAPTNYHPDSPILFLIIGSFHKNIENESTDYYPGISFHNSKISDSSKLLIKEIRRKIYSHLKNHDIKWPGCEDEILKINEAITYGLDFFGDHPSAKYLPAIQRFSGDLFEGLGENRSDLISNTRHHVLILSAAYGFLTPFEPIQDHACQFGDRNLAYDTWTKDNIISKILADYINQYKISRIFDLTYSSVTAYHECINWDVIKKTTNAEVIHCYHEFARGDKALKLFGSLLKNQLFKEPASYLLSIKPSTTRKSIKFSDVIHLSENETLRKLISERENAIVEFKSSCLWSMYITQNDIKKSNSPELNKYQKNASKFIIARSIASFLNGNGGNLIIGVKEDKKNNLIQIKGVEEEYKLLREGDRNSDGYRLMLVDMVIKKFIPEIIPVLSSLITISFHKIRGIEICWLQIRPSPKPVFVEINNEEHFCLRIESSSRVLTGKQMANYILTRFH